MRKKKELTEEMLINWWLVKYHNTTLEEIHKEHPNWTSKEFYAAFPVTDKQHDEWHDWMLKELQKYFKYSKKYVQRSSWAIYLNTAPSIKNDKK